MNKVQGASGQETTMDADADLSGAPETFLQNKMKRFEKWAFVMWFVYLLIAHMSEIPMVPRWNRKNRRTVRYICKSQFMFWLIITLVFLNTIIQVGNIAWQSRWQCSRPGHGAPSSAWVAGRLPGVHQPHIPLPLHHRNAHEDVRNVFFGEEIFR